MSKEIEQRVVEMRFDNKDFEKNVSTTMSTLEKLKQKLNLSGASKGLENVSSAAKKVDFTGISRGIESVSSHFSALEVVGITALANITNSAVNAGKRMISALTLEPVLTGFQEYETQMNAIQTILANTQSKGSTLSDVTKALDELNTYADQTIYNFTEMTKNIGTFTAAGVDLDKSVTSIKGIANLAAISGSTSAQASTAMYQLSQALAAGKVQLMDWNSVVNAGMGGEVFQNALKRTATQMGHNVDALIEKYGSFRESLTKGGWLTAEVLTETLTQLSGAYTEADLIAQGYTESQAKDIVELSKTAVDAATKVKTFTQLWDTAKEAAQSGWAQTWKLIFGDFEEAKDFFTGMSDLINNFVVASGEARNKVLGDALNSKWDTFIQKVNEAGVSTEDFTDQLTKTAKEHGVAVDKLIEEHGSLEIAISKGLLSTDLFTETLGKFSGETEESAKALKEANQYIVKSGDNLTKIATKYNMTWQELYKLNQDIIKDPNLIYPEQILKLGKAQLKQAGYTEKQISALKDLAKQAKETGTPINELIDQMGKPSGRQMLFASMSNAVEGFLKVLTTIKSAWADIYPPENLSKAIFNFIEAMYNFSEGLVMSDETADNLRRTLRGLFAILDIVTTLFTGPFKIALKVIGKLLGAMDLDILSFTAGFGDAAVALRDFLFENELVNKGIEWTADALVAGVKAIEGWVRAFLELPMVQKAIENVSNRLSELHEVGINAIEGLKNGLKDGLYSIPDILMEVGIRLLNAIKEVLGIHSPSTEMYDVGVNTIQGMINGVKDSASGIFTVLQSIAQKIIDFFKNLNWGSIVAGGVSIGLLLITKELVGVIGAITAPLEGLGDLLSGAGNVMNEAAKPIAKTIKSFSKLISAKAFSERADAVKTLALSIAILAGSLYLISKIDSNRLLSSVAALGALAAIIGVLSVAIGKWGPESSLKFVGFGFAMVGISASLLLAATAMKKLTSLDPDKMNQALGGFIVIGTTLMGILATYGYLVTGKSAKNITKLGTMMLLMSTSLLLMVGVIKLISGLSAGELIKGSAAITAFVGIVTLLSLITKLSGKGVNQLGSMMIKLSASLLLMVTTVKLISGLSTGELLKGGAAITAFVGIIALLSLITKTLGPAEIGKLGTTLIAMSTSMLILTGVIKIIAGMSVGDIVKGMAAITAFSGIIALLTAIVKMAGPEVPKISLTLLAMSVSIGILAGVAILLSLIDLAGLAKGIVAIGLLGGIISLMILATKDAQDVKGNLIVMTVAIGILAAAVVALSFIDPLKLAGATAAFSILMGMFALIIKSSANMTSSIGPLIVMTTAIGLLAGIIYVLSSLPIDSVLGVSASLSVLLLSLSASMAIISKAGALGPQALLSVGAMTLVLAGLAVIIGYLSSIPVDSTIAIASSLSQLILSLSAACVILSAVGALGSFAIAGAASLVAIIAILGVVMGGVGALVAYFPQLEQFVDTGIGLFEKIGYGLGSFFGSIVGGFAAGAVSGLPEIGKSLSQFMTNVQPFINGASRIDPKALDGVKALAETIMILTAADLLNSLTSFFTGGTTLADFAEQLVPFGIAMANFSDSIVGKVDPELVIAAATAGKALAEMAATLPNSGGVLGFFAGENDMETFGKQLIPFGEAMTGFSNAVADLKADAVEKAAIAGKSIAELASTLPNSGGVLGFFAGENDMATFATQLVPFGKAMTDFSYAVADLKADAVEKAAIAGKSIVELAKTLPNSGGVLGFFAGENDMAVFASQLVPFGEAITKFSNAVAGLKAEAVEKAAIAGKSVMELANTLPNSGGLVSFFTGDNDMATFGQQLASFGASFKKYYDSVSGIDTTMLSIVINEVEHLTRVAKGMSEIDTKSMSSFSSALVSLGNKGIDDFIAAFTNSKERVSLAVSGLLNAFVAAVNTQQVTISTSFINLINFALISIQNRYPSFTVAGQTLMTRFVLGVRSQEPNFRNTINLMMASGLNILRSNIPRFNSTAQALMVSFISGIRAHSENVKTAFTDPVNVSLTAINDRVGDFYNAGKNLVEGFANGISANTFVAEAKAAAMARAAYSAAMRALDAHSPSRLLMTVGEYFVLGFANGISDSLSVAGDSATTMAQTAVNNVKNTISRISEAIENDVDVQPTIRPVVDLSDIKAKSRSMSTLLSMNRASSISSDVQRARTTTPIQNGTSSPYSGAVFKFEQNNYSPKSLSRADIYRQTNNQFSAFERMVKA